MTNVPKRAQRPTLPDPYSAQATVGPEVFAAIMRDYRRLSERNTESLSGHPGVAYDPQSDERLDVWGIVAGESRPVVTAIHGGYWRMLSRHDTAFMAAPLAEAGIATVTVDYTLAPDATIEDMVRQVRACVAWVHQQGPAHGLDPTRIVVVGSSAGAHLAAMTALRGWQHEAGVPEDAVAAAMLISGLFDLRPLVRTFPQPMAASER